MAPAATLSPPAVAAPPPVSQPSQIPPPHGAAGVPMVGPFPGQPVPAQGFPMPGQPAPPPPAGPKTRGWWRRNIWGLVALLPVLALALAPSVKDGLDLYNRHPHEAVLPSADGWTSYSDARMRLVSFGPATDLKTYGGEPFQPPGKTKAWKATIEVEAADKESVIGCNLALEDAEGRLFGAKPDELSGARTPFPSCTPEDDEAPSPWQVEMYFVTPDSARPAAVRVTSGLHLPHYARLATS
ncbi:hypothetical protein RB614_12565 [Phytohabitans sp. ZYX-F-186]|uniref:Uncharacterized protein n=1 Tax=Phytohabitans maris TaxID=3071409 RepID=A0ABU0ZE76_9ACTN|nr:hypothetical protein [Phytohabitans sp. ZYX-F-186]MDQ7905358.1 hypothetical protein [Phytohabitans sp. ZYX-F-186]